MDKDATREVLAVYEAYLSAFMANDLNGLNKLVQYPLAHIGAGSVTLLNEYPVQPSELMTAKGWHHTIDMLPEVVFASADKAHLILWSGVRVRADGSPIEIISAFYGLTRTPDGWKIFAFSDIAIPA